MYKNLKYHSQVVSINSVPIEQANKYKDRCPVCNKMFYSNYPIKPGLCCSSKCQDKTNYWNNEDFNNSL